MAIATVDDIIAGVKTPQFFFKGLSGTLVAGRPHSYWATAGIPGAGSFDNTLAGVALSSTSALVAGQIPYSDPTAGDNKHLARFVGTVGQVGVLMLCDRLWHNGNFDETSTGSQTVNSATWPARDNNGSTNGEGVLLGVEIETVTTTNAPTITVGYTNSDNTSGRTGTNIVATASASPAGAFFPISLQAGDKGVRSVQSLTLSASWGTGVIHLVAYRVLAAVEIVATNAAGTVDPITSGLPRMYDGSVPFLLFYPSTTTSSRAMGQVVYVEG